MRLIRGNSQKPGKKKQWIPFEREISELKKQMRKALKEAKGLMSSSEQKLGYEIFWELRENLSKEISEQEKSSVQQNGIELHKLLIQITSGESLAMRITILIQK